MSITLRSGSRFNIVLSRVLKSSPHFEGAVSEPASVNSTQLLDETVEKWQTARIRRDSRKVRSKRLVMRSYHVPSYASLGAAIANDLGPAARKGLLGEIVTQLLLSDCCSQIQIQYLNWEYTGTANRYGIDLVGFADQDTVIVLIECKFC